MSQTLVQLHTLEQWAAQPEGVRADILRNIKLKDYVWRYLDARRKKPDRMEAEWVKCSTCSSTWPDRQNQQQYPGYVLKEPRYDGLHPSQVGGECSLKIYWEMKGKEGRDMFPPRMQFLLDLGTQVHNLIQGYGEDGAFGPHYRKEVTVTGMYQAIAKALMLEGSADAENTLQIEIESVPNTIFELTFVHEYKSCSKNVFDKLTSPKPKHALQALLYAAALNRPVVVYMYVNKDNSDIKDFAVQFDAAKWQILLNKVTFLIQNFVTDVPPEATPGYHCEDCRFSFDCDARRSKTRARPR